MKITKVKVFPVNEEKLKAFVTIVLDDCFLVRDLKIIQGPKGRFVAMPSKKRKNGKYEEMAHPLNAETRASIEEAIFDEYNKVINSGVYPEDDSSMNEE